MEPGRRRILNYETAHAINAELFSSAVAEFSSWMENLRETIDEQRDQLAEVKIDWERLLKATDIAVTVGVAMFSMRYGIGSRLPNGGFTGYDCLEYHNTQHALDIIARLDKVCDYFGPKLFPPQRRILLMLFALFHDLRQQETGEVVGGVGANERASAEEASAILEYALSEAGFDPERDKDLFSYLVEGNRFMIHGTTFNFVSSTSEMLNPYTNKRGTYTIPVGALAPMIVEQIKEAFPDWKKQPRLLEHFENILLGADVDTANVSDSFYDFAVQGVNLCREIEKRKGNLVCEPAAVYGFMTGGQEYYFHVAQKYNSVFSREVFTPFKAMNGARLAELTKAIRKRWGNPEDDGKTLRSGHNGQAVVDGETILEEYLANARELTKEGE